MNLHAARTWVHAAKDNDCHEFLSCSCVRSNSAGPSVTLAAIAGPLYQASPCCLADRGYYNGEQIRQCEQQGMKTLVPKPLTSGNKAAGLFNKRDFIYVPQHDAFRCPVGQTAKWRFTAVEKGLTMHKYWSSACTTCPIKSRCTSGKNRRITRWEHEDVLDRMQTRLAHTPEAPRLRRSTVEHPFGTLKHWMGSTHFLARMLGWVEHRNESACAGLQPEACDANPRR